MNGNIKSITKESIKSHTLVLASHCDEHGCKMISHIIETGYLISYSKSNGDEKCGHTENIDEAVLVYNSLDLSINATDRVAQHSIKSNTITFKIKEK